MPKDAPVFSESNKTVGHINYPPYEAGNNLDLEARHHEFRIFPLGQIYKKGVRHIPYNSDKKDFLDKTGRDAFEGRYSLCIQSAELTKQKCFSTRTSDPVRTKSMS